MEWRIRADGYVVLRGAHNSGTKMHFFILPRSQLEGDHINRNKLDNRRINLRHATSAQNLQNKQRGVSGYLGVRKNGKKWKAEIVKQGVVYYIGTYRTTLEAAKAYNNKAVEIYGATATLNAV